jgi:hypothetical protein
MAPVPAGVTFRSEREMHLVLSIAIGIVLGYYLIEYINHRRERRAYRRGLKLLNPHPPKQPGWFWR